MATTQVSIGDPRDPLLVVVGQEIGCYGRYDHDDKIGTVENIDQWGRIHVRNGGYVIVFKKDGYEKTDSKYNSLKLCSVADVRRRQARHEQARSAGAKVARLVAVVEDIRRREQARSAGAKVARLVAVVEDIRRRDYITSTKQAELLALVNALDTVEQREDSTVA